MFLYRNKNSGAIVAAEELTQTKRFDDPFARKYGAPGRNSAVGDYAMWYGGRHVKYVAKAAFEAEFERL